MGSFVSLYTAFSGLQAAQTGLDTTSNNIANASTVGYTRQRVETATRRSYQSLIGQIGQGVKVTDITRGRQELLDNRVRASASSLGQFTSMASLMTSIEAALGEPDSGITVALNNLWSSFDDLSLDPTSGSARAVVLSSLGSITSSVRNVSTAWTTVADNAVRDLAANVEEANLLITEVASLNRSIIEASAQQGSPNGLMDQREVALDKLASLVGATSRIDDDGSARVSLGGLFLVSGVTPSGLTFDAATNSVVHASGAVAQTGGEIGGLQSFVTTEYPTMIADLDAFVTDLATALNTQSAAGFAPTGAPGGDLLSFGAGSPSASLTVAITDGNDLATAATAGPPFPSFDATNVEALAALRTALSGGGGTQSIDDVMRTIIGSIGASTSASISGAESQLALTSAADIARSNAHGVNIDEEMVNLIIYQRSYESAARVMTAIDQNLDTLINRTGIVGR